jgi:uncharacterized protein with HEPN domain
MNGDIPEEIKELIFEKELIRNSIRQYLQNADVDAYNSANNDLDAIDRQIEIIRNKNR